MIHDCPHLSRYKCASAVYYIHRVAIYADCPTGCALPHTCDTCGRRSCYAVDSGNDEDDDCEDWLAPCYYEELDEDPEEVEA
jgi:hypothetical protein